jgi:peptide/nickel transport system substrate-binding protein
MNEFLQQNLAEVGIQIDFEVVEWNTLINIWRAGAKHESSKAATGMNYTYFIQDPFTGFVRHLQCNLAPPAGTNWGFYCDPEMDKLFEAVRTTFDAAGAGPRSLEKIHEKIRRRGAVPDGHSRRQRRVPCRPRSRASCRPRTGSRTSRRSR